LRLVYANRRDESSLMSWDPASDRTRTLAESPSMHWLPEISPAGDRFSFFANVAGDMQVFLIDGDGTDQRQVTFGTSQNNIHPSWSADGSALYYYGSRSDQGAPRFSWRRVNVDGSADTEVVAGWQWLTHNHARVDATGRQALYTRIHSDTGEYANDTTYVRDLRTGRERAVEAPHLHGARWSPDGRQLVGQRHDGSVALCDAASLRCRTLVRGTRPVLCPDGRHLYFQRDTTRTSATVWRVELSTGHEEQLGSIGPFHPLSPSAAVTADHQVVFMRFHVGRSALWVMDLARTP
jgi:hypothetical protein